MQLRPTLWRTARALANPDRLRLMRLVAKAQGEKCVVDLAAAAGLSVPTTSTYLRALNARGLISVRRSGPYVYYGTASDRSLPTAIAIQQAFRNLFARRSLPEDWTERLIPLLRAYSHPRREMIIDIVYARQPVHYIEIQKRSGIGDAAFVRHLRMITAAGILVRDENGRYSLSKPANSLAAAFLSGL